MSGVRQWVLLLCCGCILYGIIENLLPRKGVYPVIKAVFTLYILLILLSPVKTVFGSSGYLAQNNFSAAESVTASEVSTENFLNKTEAILQTKLENGLESSGLDVQLETLEVSGNQENIDRIFVRLRLGENTTQSQAEQLCNDLLGVKGVYEFENG